MSRAKNSKGKPKARPAQRLSSDGAWAAEGDETKPYSQGLATAYVSGGELKFSRRMSRWILHTLCRGPAGTMLDLACGAGEAVRVFEAAGWRAAGVDKSEAMLEIARALGGAHVAFQQAAMPDIAHVGSEFDLVTCMYDAINCNLRKEGLVATFRAVHGLLKPGGRFVFDAFSVSGLRRAYTGLELHTRNSKHIVLTHAWFDPDKQIGTKELLGASRLPDWTPWREVHRVRAYPPAMLVEWLMQTGFESVSIYAWPCGIAISSDEADDLDRFVIAAQR